MFLRGVTAGVALIRAAGRGRAADPLGLLVASAARARDPEADQQARQPGDQLDRLTSRNSPLFTS
jgi:hypothetical protein